MVREGRKHSESVRRGSAIGRKCQHMRPEPGVAHQRITLSRMHQDASSFWEFQQAIQTTNVLLKGTPHHLDDKKLRERIEAGMDQVLYVQATNAKYNEIVELRDWLSKVKSLDDEKHFEHLQAIKASEQSAAASCAVSHANTINQSQNGVLTSPSCKANSGPTASAPADSAAAKSDYPPKLTEEEKALLLK